MDIMATMTIYCLLKYTDIPLFRVCVVIGIQTSNVEGLDLGVYGSSPVACICVVCIVRCRVLCNIQFCVIYVHMSVFIINYKHNAQTE
jgi:uncharacterized protein YwlG (UPF0340 family)